MVQNTNQNKPGGFRIKLRVRLFFAFFVTVLLPLGVFAVLSLRVIFNGVSTLEDAALQDSLHQTTIAVRSEEQQLAANVQDYARWDDMFDPVISRDAEWQRRNITEWIPKQFNVDMIWLADDAGHVFYSYNVPPEFTTNVDAVSLFSSARRGEQRSGLMKTSVGMIMAASSYVTPSSIHVGFDPSTESPAVLFYGRFIDSSLADKISSLTDRPIDVFDTSKLIATSDPDHELLLGSTFSEIVPTVNSAAESVQKIVFPDRQGIFTPLQDVDNRRIGLIGIYRTSPTANFVRSQLNNTLGVAVLLAFSVGIALSLYFGTRLSRSVKRLNEEVQSYTRGDFHHPVSVDRGDELGELQASFAYMIKTLERAKVRIEEQELTILDVLARAAAAPQDVVGSTKPKENRRKRS